MIKLTNNSGEKSMKIFGIIGAMPSELKDIQTAQVNPVKSVIAGDEF